MIHATCFRVLAEIRFSHDRTVLGVYPKLELSGSVLCRVRRTSKEGTKIYIDKCTTLALSGFSRGEKDSKKSLVSSDRQVLPAALPGNFSWRLLVVAYVLRYKQSHEKILSIHHRSLAFFSFGLPSN